MLDIASSHPVTLTETRHGRGGGLLIESPGAALRALERDFLMSRLAHAGYLLLRGFRTDVDGFSALVRRMSARVTLDPARGFGGKDTVAQKVDAGFDAVGLHCENANSPFVPQLCWFHCEKAASAGSQTTVCDGYGVWDMLGATTRQAFLERDIVYSRRVEAVKWRTFAFHRLDGKKRIDEITLRDVIGDDPDLSRTRVTLEDDGAIRYAHRVAAAHPTLFGQRLAFANSILGPSFNYEKPTITFDDGEAIPPSIVAEIEWASAACTENIGWRDGDVLLIDNTRVMHGRRAIVDPLRTIYNALSDLNQVRVAKALMT